MWPTLIRHRYMVLRNDSFGELVNTVRLIRYSYPRRGNMMQPRQLRSVVTRWYRTS